MKQHGWLVCGMAAAFALGMAVQAARGSSEEAKLPRVTGIGGVFFKTSDPAATAKWYREHLGIELTPAGSKPSAMQYHVFEWSEKDPSAPKGSTVFSIFPASSKYFDPTTAPFMINFRVANLDRLLAQLKAEGVTTEPKMADESGGKFAWAIDPDGRRIELWEPK